MNRSRLLVFLLAGLLIAGVFSALVYLSLGYHRYEVEVCMTFKGRSNCGTAAGASREEAQSAATRVACSTISGGVTETIACDRTPPDSVRWISE
ncbi:MAG: hypothetical protein PVJ49_11620 [Acidobacteriota bacterium]|jgi:hypothetical protein